MNYWGRAENASNIRDEYIVIGRCLNYAIVKDELDNLFYIEDENVILSEGDLCEKTFLKSVDELPGIIREIIAISYERGVA